MDLDLRRLRYFVTVAEELSFVRAADLLHMTQPALSRQIIALEHDLGFRLFDRDRQGTSLTSGGRQLLEDAIPLLAASAALERRARLAGRGATRFSIGFMPGVDSTPIIREFAARAPYLTIGVIHTSLTDQLDFLVDGRVDVCFVRLPLGDETFTTLPLFPEPQVAAVPSAHPMAEWPAIEINQVAGLPLLQDREEVPEWRGALAEPRPWPVSDLRRPPTIEEKLERVALGDGVVVLPAGIAGFYRRADISYVPVADVAPRMVALAYSKHRTMPELEEFAKLATSMLGNGGENEPVLPLRAAPAAVIACRVMAGLRFGIVSESVRPGRAWLDFARQVEDSGIDVLLLRDHFSAGPFGQQLAPFSGLASAAAVTTRLRLGTLVLSNDFRHPAIVAHEAASLHLISGGRFELGIGAGWYQPEYDAAGIAFGSAGARLERLDASLAIIRDLLAGTPVHHADASYRIDGLDLDVLPLPRPDSPKLLVGAGGPRMLRLAARHADIVGVLPAPIRDSADGDDPRDRLPAAFDAKIAVLREAAGDRFGDLEISALGTFVVTDRRQADTEELIARRGWGGIEAETVWEMPTIFIGSPEQIRADLQARLERFGLSYLVAAEDDRPALAEIIGGR